MPADLNRASLGQIAIVVQDLPRATAFYRDTLGLPFLFEFPGLSFFQCGEVRLMLSRAEKAEFDHPGSLLYYKVPDAEVACRTLEDRGVRFVEAPHVVHRTETSELWIGTFLDSEGNHAAVMAEKSVSATR